MISYEDALPERITGWLVVATLVVSLAYLLRNVIFFIIPLRIKGFYIIVFHTLGILLEAFRITELCIMLTSKEMSPVSCPADGAQQIFDLSATVVNFILGSFVIVIMLQISQSIRELNGEHFNLQRSRRVKYVM